MPPDDSDTSVGRRYRRSAAALAVACGVAHEVGAERKKAKAGDEKMMDAFAAFATFEMLLHILQHIYLTLLFGFDKCHNSV